MIFFKQIDSCLQKITLLFTWLKIFYGVVVNMSFQFHLPNVFFACCIQTLGLKEKPTMNLMSCHGTMVVEWISPLFPLALVGELVTWPSAPYPISMCLQWYSYMWIGVKNHLTRVRTFQPYPWHNVIAKKRKDGVFEHVIKEKKNETTSLDGKQM